MGLGIPSRDTSVILADEHSHTVCHANADKRGRPMASSDLETPLTRKKLHGSTEELTKSTSSLLKVSR